MLRQFDACSLCAVIFSGFLFREVDSHVRAGKIELASLIVDMTMIVLELGEPLRILLIGAPLHGLRVTHSMEFAAKLHR